ncbi:NADPH-dependent FMN reductase [Sphingobium chungbukense]|nr:NAD(P)H-dependent oxidoreductase [Sphingobium chungbukense]
MSAMAARSETETDKMPFIIGLGGSAAPTSSTEQALSLALRAAERRGARTKLHGGNAIASLPHYLTPGSKSSALARELVADFRRADGLIIASPGYHGTISAIVKNALEYFEDTSKDDRIYLDGVPVGLIATAYGWQATGGTLVTLRSIVHALRGFPTPLGAAINTSDQPFKDGECLDVSAARQLTLVGDQVFEFARMKLAI